MSYARFSDGDVYVFFSVDNVLECCGCILQECEWVDVADSIIGGYLSPVGEIVKTRFDSTQGMVDHLQRHIDAGHHVPDYVVPALWDDDAENFAAAPSGSPQEGPR